MPSDIWDVRLWLTEALNYRWDPDCLGILPPEILLFWGGFPLSLAICLLSEVAMGERLSYWSTFAFCWAMLFLLELMVLCVIFLRSPWFFLLSWVKFCKWVCSLVRVSLMVCELLPRLSLLLTLTWFSRLSMFMVSWRRSWSLCYTSAMSLAISFCFYWSSTSMRLYVESFLTCSLITSLSMLELPWWCSRLFESLLRLRLYFPLLYCFTTFTLLLIITWDVFGVGSCEFYISVLSLLITGIFYG